MYTYIDMSMHPKSRHISNNIITYNTSIQATTTTTTTTTKPFVPSIWGRLHEPKENIIQVYNNYKYHNLSWIFTTCKRNSPWLFRVL